MAGLKLDAISKSFGGHAALREVALDAADGEFIAVLGPSGCGKTTMLRLIAGFDAPDSGSISIGGRVVCGPGIHVPPEQRRMGIVFQSYALWPHMDVAGNVAYALKVQGVPQAERAARVARALDLVGLAAFAARRPAMLSGGQRQRVALARCLAMEPAMVLLDEPLANLDVHLRASMEEEFAAFHKRTGTTMFYITHDQAEAMALADRIAVMDQGRILQMATPSVLYREPANAIVARFIGGGMVLPVEIAGAPQAGRIQVQVGHHRALVRCRADAAATGPALLCVRAGDLALVAADADGLPGTIQRLIYQGGHFLADVALADVALVDVALAAGAREMLQLSLPEPAPVAVGDNIRVAIRDGWLL